MFGLFRKKPTPSPSPAHAGSAPGWDAIWVALARRYPDQKARSWAPKGPYRWHDLRTPPRHPLDAVEVYDAGTFWHFVTFGLTDLYEKVTPGPVSGLGHELTFRLAKTDEEDGAPPIWPIRMLEGIARAELGGELLGPRHWITCGPLDGRKETAATALLVVEDDAFPVLETPHGTVTLLQLVALTAEELDRIRHDGPATLAALRAADLELAARVG